MKQMEISDYKWEIWSCEVYSKWQSGRENKKLKQIKIRLKKKKDLLSLKWNIGNSVSEN